MMPVFRATLKDVIDLKLREENKHRLIQKKLKIEKTGIKIRLRQCTRKWPCKLREIDKIKTE
jgi:hypothetical protein